MLASRYVVLASRSVMLTSFFSEHITNGHKLPVMSNSLASYTREKSAHEQNLLRANCSRAISNEHLIRELN